MTLTKGNKITILMALATLAVAGLACDQTSQAPYSDIPPDFKGTGEIFVWAVAYGDEERAMSELTANTQSAVAHYCNNGKVIECLKKPLNDWSQFNNVAYLPSYSQGSTATYQITWKDGATATWIVLQIVKEDGEWRIDSWRGLIPIQAGRIQGLIDGTDTTNLFPPGN